MREIEREPELAVETEVAAWDPRGETEEEAP